MNRVKKNLAKLVLVGAISLTVFSPFVEKASAAKVDTVVTSYMENWSKATGRHWFSNYNYKELKFITSYSYTEKSEDVTPKALKFLGEYYLEYTRTYKTW